MNKNETNKVHIVPNSTKKYMCDICEYNTSRYSHLLRHLMTSKHIKRYEMKRNETKTDNSEFLVPNKNNNVFTCICGNIYNSRTTLWRHKNICNNTTNKIFTPEMFMEMMKQNNEFKELLIEQNKQNDKLTKQIFELSSKPTTTTNNNNTNNFNLQFFLNETCKDALNIKDFVNQLHVGIPELEETGRLGYAAGISKIFINGLKQLDINQRPVHCSDLKRETIYIKDENLWAKEDAENPKLTSAIREVAHKNIQQISAWTEQHPEYMDSRSKCSDKYLKIVVEAMPGSTPEESDKNYKKIARNITKESVIGK